MARRFYFVDVFAAETNYSETTFVTHVPEHDGGYSVRIFTPAERAEGG